MKSVQTSDTEPTWWWGTSSGLTPTGVEPSNVSEPQNNFNENIERVFGLVSILFGLQKWPTQVTLSVYNTVSYPDLSSDPISVILQLRNKNFLSSLKSHFDYIKRPNKIQISNLQCLVFDKLYYTYFDVE